MSKRLRGRILSRNFCVNAQSMQKPQYRILRLNVTKLIEIYLLLVYNFNMSSFGRTHGRRIVRIHPKSTCRKGENIMEKKRNKKGFTLAELLIVVAIIAVLVAIAIPIFTTQLERSREATDLSNIRSAYAEATTEYLATNSAASATASIRQKDASWHIDHELMTRVNGSESPVSLADVNPGGTATVKIDNSGSVTVSFAAN